MGRVSRLQWGRVRIEQFYLHRQGEQNVLLPQTSLSGGSSIPVRLNRRVINCGALLSPMLAEPVKKFRVSTEIHKYTTLMSEYDLYGDVDGDGGELGFFREVTEANVLDFI